VTALRKAPMPQPGSRIVLVTAAMAGNWLENCNSHNRDMSQPRVDMYARDMEQGRWQFNGEPIQFDIHGVLMNGQHRLRALIQSGSPQQFVIVTGVDSSSQITMDQGTRRSPSDQLAVADIKVDGTVASAIRLYMRWYAGRLFGDAVSNRISTTEIVEWAQSHPDVLETIRNIRATLGTKRIVGVAPALVLSIALRFHMIDYEDAAEFFTQLKTMTDVPPKSPVAALWKKLDRARDERIRYTERDQIAFFVVAWNAFREQRPMQLIQRPPGNGWTRETFPYPK
jgi:hypothetical protein